MADSQFTLLLVDDNPTNLTLLAKIIEFDLPQVRVLAASSAVEGLGLAAREQIDGAFIDVQMPEMSGLEMCRRLKTDPRTAGMPLVLITAHIASPEMRAEGLEVGAYDFISQPISNVEMLARIKVMLRLCEGERQSRENRSLDPVSSGSVRLRWLSGLLLSGNGKLSDADQRLLQGLSAEDDGELDDPALLKLLHDKFPRPWQRTFCKLALLGSAPVVLAGKVSEIEDVEASCDYLRRHDALLLPATDSLLRFKPEAEQALRLLAEELLSAEGRSQLYLLAADWYQQKNDPLAAFSCLLQGEQYAAISQLFSQSGLGLLAESYQPTFAELLSRLPEEKAVTCGWMSLYAGVGFMLSQPHEVDTWLELARNRFVAANDQRGELLTLSQQLLQYLLADGQAELGLRRLQRVRELGESQLELLSSYNRLTVLFSQAMGELFYASDLTRCEDLLSLGLRELVREQWPELQADFSLLQALLGIFQGRFRVARAAMEQALATCHELPETSLRISIFRLIACELFYCLGELDSFVERRHLVRQFWQGGDFQQTALWPVLDFFDCLTALARGEFPLAEERLEVSLLESAATGRPHLRSWLLQLRGLLYAETGRANLARDACAEGLELRQKVEIDLHRLPNLLLAGATMMRLEDFAKAAEYLRAGLQLSEQLQEGRYRGGFHAWLAAVFIAEQDREAALRQLGYLFELLRRQQVGFFFALSPELLRELVPLAATVAEWRAPLQQLCERWLDCRVDENGRLVQLARLQTLGNFSFDLQGKKCELTKVGQSSRQLLALLAVAPNYTLSSELIMGTLWPDSPTDKARNSFDTALSRLRKVLETVFGKQVRRDYLILEKGMLLLRNLRIDIDDFSSQLEASRRHLQRRNFWQAELAFRRADRYWGGEFLAGFELEADLPYQREQYNRMRLEQLEGLARLLLARRNGTEAERVLQLGLAFDSTHDGLVRKLIDLYQQRKDTRSIHQLVEKYRRALQAEEYDAEEIEELITTLDPQRFKV